VVTTGVQPSGSVSTTVFRAPLGALARVVLTLPDGWTPVVTTPARRLPHRH